MSPVPFVYNADDPMPIEASAETIEIVAKARGGVAESELSEAVLTLDAELLSRRARMVDENSIRQNMPKVRDILARRRVYASRLSAIRRTLGSKAKPPGDPPELADFVRILADSTEGQDVRGQLSTVLAQVQGEIDHASKEVDDLVEILGDDARYVELGKTAVAPYAPMLAEMADIITRTSRLARFKSPADLHTQPDRPTVRLDAVQASVFRSDAVTAYANVTSVPANVRTPQWPQDALVERIDAKVRQRKALEARLAALKADNAQATKVVADRVQRAVEAAGGVDLIAGDIAAASVLVGRISPNNSALKAKAEEGANTIRRLSMDLENLTVLGSGSSSAAQSLRADIEQAQRIVEQARKELTANHATQSAELVKAAIDGDEQARATIESLTTARPEAFPPGFPAAIAAARFDRAAAEELQHVLETKPARKAEQAA